jgi:hypothetical protein
MTFDPFSPLAELNLQKASKVRGRVQRSNGKITFTESALVPVGMPDIDTEVHRSLLSKQQSIFHNRTKL